MHRVACENDRQLPDIRSRKHEIRSFIQFCNTTEDSVILYWIDYQGQRISYGKVSPGDVRDINTFVTHPWIFVNAETEERYVHKQEDVYWPIGFDGPIDRWVPRHRRTIVHITLPLYSLQKLAMRAIKKCLTDDSQAYELDIPRALQSELFYALPRKTRRVKTADKISDDYESD